MVKKYLIEYPKRHRFEAYKIFSQTISCWVSALSGDTNSVSLYSIMTNPSLLLWYNINSILLWYYNGNLALNFFVNRLGELVLLDSGESTTTLACSCCTMQQSFFLSPHAHVPRSVPHAFALLFSCLFFSFPFLIQISFHAHLALCANTIVCAPSACFPIFHITLINCPLKTLLSMCTHPFFSRQRFSTLLI